MLAANGSIEKMRPESSLIGRAGREHQLESLKEEFANSAEVYARENEQLSKVLDEKNHANSLPVKLLNLCQKIAETPNLVELVAKRQVAQSEFDRLQAEPNQLDTRDVDAWRMKIEQFKKIIATRKREEETPRHSRNEEITISMVEKDVHKKQKASELQTALEDRSRCTKALSFRQDAAANQFENFMKEFSESYAKVEELARISW